jgi:[acyl-carrier-protein] S-malonyltransferase
MKTDKVISAFIFPGQGPHHADMLKILKTIPNGGFFLERLKRLRGIDLEELIRIKGDDILRENKIASFATAVFSMTCHRWLQANNYTPQYVAGYSVGQYVAMWAAEMIADQQLFEILETRADLMDEFQAQTGSGAMLAVIGLPTKLVEATCESVSFENSRVCVSNYNCEGQLTLAGHEEAVARVKEKLIQLKARQVTDVYVSGAWHCFMQIGVAKSFRKYLETVVFSPAKLMVLDNTNGEPLPDNHQELVNHLQKHLYLPVRWRDCVKTLLQYDVVRFIEVGYGNMLCKYGMFIDRSVKHVAVSNLIQE